MPKSLEEIIAGFDALKDDVLAHFAPAAEVAPSEEAAEAPAAEEAEATEEVAPAV